MLRTRSRALLLDSLRPPAGYRLRRAVGTSYTLDLMALLTVPLAFTFFDAHDEDGSPVTDPVALLEALRRHASRITLFCQAGGIKVPGPDQRLLAYLEGSVVQVQPKREGGIFHPKVWVLDFESDSGPPVYRVLCLSRNLTFARAWDTCLRLEGRLAEGWGDRPRNKPFAEFLEALPEISTRSIPTELADDLSRMAREIGRTDFEPPKPFKNFRVHHFGLGTASGLPFPSGGRGLVASPFLASSVVRDLKRDHGLEVLISRHQAFEEVVRGSGRKALPVTCYVLSSDAGLDARDAEEEEHDAVSRSPTAGHAPEDGPNALRPEEDRVELAGLHAKFFLFENGRESRLFTGSANATDAAFHRNVEVLVELVGGTKECGIDALLGTGDDPALDTLRSLLREYPLPDSMPQVDAAQRELEMDVDRLARGLGAVGLTATVSGAEGERKWDVTLSGSLPGIPAEAEVRAWPTTLPAEAAVHIDRPEESSHEPGQPDRPANRIATFSRLSFEALTAFFAFEVVLRKGPRQARKRFAVTADLVGAPKDRKERLLRSLLQDRGRVLRLLFLILMGDGADVSAFVQAERRAAAGGRQSFAGWDRGALLEALLGSLSRDPKRLDDAARLIDDLDSTPKGRELLPEGLHEIWDPVWAARKALDS